MCIRKNEVVPVYIEDQMLGMAKISYGTHGARRISFFKDKHVLNELKKAHKEGKEILLKNCGGRYPVKWVKVYEEDVDTRDRSKKRLRFYARAKK